MSSYFIEKLVVHLIEYAVFKFTRIKIIVIFMLCTSA